MILIHLKRADVVPSGVKEDLTQSILAGMHVTLGRVIMKMNYVSGESKGHIILYALSTCVWCRKTKQLLDQLGVEYDHVDVDLLEGEEKTKATEEVKNLNPRCSFPTLAVGGKCIVGFDEQKIRESVR